MENAERAATDRPIKQATELRDAHGGAMEEKDARVARMPSFATCSIEQKLERLRDALMTVAAQQRIIGPIAISAQNLAENHDHGTHGVMKPLGSKFLNEPGYSNSPMDSVLALLR